MLFRHESHTLEHFFNGEAPCLDPVTTYATHFHKYHVIGLKNHTTGLCISTKRPEETLKGEKE
jgi:hypothetical protein